MKYMINLFTHLYCNSLFENNKIHVKFGVTEIHNVNIGFETQKISCFTINLLIISSKDFFDEA